MSKRKRSIADDDVEIEEKKLKEGLKKTFTGKELNLIADDDVETEEKKLKEGLKKTSNGKELNLIADDDVETEEKKLKEGLKKTSTGKEFNLKISSWNVNGVRAWLKKDGLDYVVAEEPDIMCMQELKCDEDKLPPQLNLKGYHCFWLAGSKAGYAGVGIMSKVEPINVVYELDEERHAEEGRTIIAEYEKFILVNSYIPNSGRGLVRLDYRMDWEQEMRKKLGELEKKKPIIWCGDLNVAHKEIDLKNPKTNSKTAGFTKEERKCFGELLSDGYFDSYRYLYPDTKDAFTFWTYMRNARASNVGWRLDYFVMSDKLKTHLVDNVIRPQVMGSDHCPIELFLKL